MYSIPNEDKTNLDRVTSSEMYPFSFRHEIVFWKSLWFTEVYFMKVKKSVNILIHATLNSRKSIIMRIFLGQ